MNIRFHAINSLFYLPKTPQYVLSDFKIDFWPPFFRICAAALKFYFYLPLCEHRFVLFKQLCLGTNLFTMAVVDRVSSKILFAIQNCEVLL